MLPPKEFLKKIKPFEFMSEGQLAMIIAGLEVASYRKNTTIYRQGAKGLPVYVVFSGLVCLYRNEEIIDYASRGELFGISAALDRIRSPLGARALEDSVCYILKREHFRAVTHQNPKVAEFFAAFLSRKFHSFSESTRKSEIMEQGAFAADVGQLVIQRPVTCSPDATMLHAASAMESHGVGSIIAAGESGEPLGILTNKDLRRMVTGGSKADPVSRYMSSPVLTVGMETPLLEAFSTMMSAEIDHLVVLDGGSILGVVTSKDVLTKLAPSSAMMTFYRKILKAHDVEELKATFTGVRHAVASMALRDFRFHELSRIMTTVHDTIVKEALHFAAQRHPPGDFLWFHMGSHGRREQVIARDQDTALICRGDPPRSFAALVTEILDEVGIPRCGSGFTASNALWNVGIDGWIEYFRTWFSAPTPENLSRLAMFLDIRPVYGDMELYGRLLASIHECVTEEAVRHLARHAVAVRIPIGIFQLKSLDRGLDLKELGIFPIVNGIRVLTVENRILEVVNTRDRIEALHAMGALGHGTHADLLECYGFLQSLRLKHQARQIMDNRQVTRVTDRMRIHELDKMDLLILKEVLKMTSSFQNFLRNRYGVGGV
jgi:CBS domain-containing protein